MISGFTLFCIGFVGIVCCAVPPIAALLLYKKCGGTAAAFFWGCGMYIMFNIVLSTPVGAILTMTPLAEQLWFTVLYSGLTAAMMDGFGRIAIFRWGLKNEQKPVNALLYGLGFSWVDCVVLLGIDSIFTAAFGATYNRDPAALDALGAPEMVAALTQQLQNTDIGNLLASCAARLLACVLQMALAQLMMTAVAKRKGWYTVLTIVLQHVCVCIVVWVGEVTQSMPLCLAVRVVFLAAAILLALRTKTLWEETEPTAGAPRSETGNTRLPRRSL